MLTPVDPDRYRPNVGLALFAPSGAVFLGRRIGVAGPHQWQMPQGGIDLNESPQAAALRELEEEIGVPANLVDLLEETPDWLAYDFPEPLRARLGWGQRWLGQRQKWFALRFLGEDRDIALDRHTPEFDSWRWERLEAAPALVVPFKRIVYEEVARRFARFAAKAPE